MMSYWQIATLSFFLIYSQFGVIHEPDSGCVACKIYIPINSNLLSYKNWKQNTEEGGITPTPNPHCKMNLPKNPHRLGLI